MFNKIKGNDIIAFVIGMVMTVVGGYLFMNNVEVSSSAIFSFSIMGRRMDGLIFLPLIASIIYLFFSYNKISKFCCILSLAIIIVNVLMNLRLHWNGTSLYATLIIFVLFFGGIGLVMKTLFANPDGAHGKKY